LFSFELACKRALVFFIIFSFTIPPQFVSSIKPKIINSEIIKPKAIVLASGLNYSTFLGSRSDEIGTCIAIASDGSSYITGRTSSENFPTLNAFDNTYGGSLDAFVAKFSSNGTLLWSTFLGGSNQDEGWGIALNSDDSCCYIVGSTYSDNFPTLNAYNSTYGGNCDVFITKLDENGTLLWSTFLGGNKKDCGKSITVASDGRSYLIGSTNSSNFPILEPYSYNFSGGINDGDVFISKLSNDCSLLWSTYFGGETDDVGMDIAIADDESLYLTGYTSSSNFPTINAYDNTSNSFFYTDAFVAKFHANKTLLWSTYLGGGLTDDGYGIAVANNNSCYITGRTCSYDFPVLGTDSMFSGIYDVFVTQFYPNGSLLWSTYFGGNSADYGYGITVDYDGNYFVTGSTQSIDFPRINPYDNTYSYSSDAFISKFAINNSLIWSTFLGGSSSDSAQRIAIGSDGSCFLTGSTRSYNFPLQNAYDDSLGGYQDVFITKFSVIDDIIGPSIANTGHYPLVPFNDEIVTVRSYITDICGIEQVTLHYQVNAGSWIYEVMQEDLGTSYIATLGPFNGSDLVKYYIEASDNSFNHNIAIDDNNTHLYLFTVHASTTILPTTTFTQEISIFGFLTILVTLPIFVFVLRKRRK